MCRPRGYSMRGVESMGGCAWTSMGEIECRKGVEVHQWSLYTTLKSLFFFTGYLKAPLHVSVIADPWSLQCLHCPLVGGVLPDASGDRWVLCYLRVLLLQVRTIGPHTHRRGLGQFCPHIQARVGSVLLILYPGEGEWHSQLKGTFDTSLSFCSLHRG